jgi:Flp pilus assembly protein TadD
VNPVFIDARGNLASAIFQTGRFADAAAHYHAVLESRPNHGEAWFNLALALTRLGRNAEAVAAHEAVLRLNPDDARARGELARLRALNPPAPR